MAGIFVLSINPEVYKKGDFANDLLWGSFYQQHLGEEHSGVAIRRDSQVVVGARPGLFRANFAKELDTFQGTEGMGYCGPAEEPFEQKTRLGEIAVCFSGNVLNRRHLVEEFTAFGHTLQRGDDIEVILKLVAQGRDVVDGITRMNEEVQGSYALAVLGQDGLTVASCPGHWPLVLGEKEGAIAVATDPSGFSNQGFKILRDLEPGEIVCLRGGKAETRQIISLPHTQICSFMWVYTGFPVGGFRGIPFSRVRKRLGAAHARRDIERGFIPNIVAPIPDSGRFHAIGYHQEFCRQANASLIKRVPLYDEVLLKYPYAGRSFTPQTQQARDLEAHIKLLESSESYEGQVVVICDDSIVRGTQTQRNLVPKLRHLGVDEIHFRISNPELRSYCPWGKTTKKGELFATRYPSGEERIRILNIGSLEYSTIPDLIAAIGLPSDILCADCSRD